MPTRKAPVRTKASKHAAPKLQLSNLANVGPATLADLHRLGIRTVRQLARRDALALYRSLCRRTGKRHDPCVIDVFMAIIHQARGGKAMPWWKFTKERKRAVAEAARPSRD
jgi:hypothetical protein